MNQTVKEKISCVLDAVLKEENDCIDDLDVNLVALCSKIQPTLRDAGVESDEIEIKSQVLAKILNSYADTRLNVVTVRGLQDLLSDERVTEIMMANSLPVDKSLFANLGSNEWESLVDFSNHIINCQAILKHPLNKVICMKASAILTGFDNCLVGSWKSLGKAVRRRHLLFHYFTGVNRTKRVQRGSKRAANDEDNAEEGSQAPEAKVEPKKPRRERSTAESRAAEAAASRPQSPPPESLPEPMRLPDLRSSVLLDVSDSTAWLAQALMTISSTMQMRASQSAALQSPPAPLPACPKVEA